MMVDTLNIVPARWENATVDSWRIEEFGNIRGE